MAWRMPSDVSGYVLAGGRSSRMGRNKALLTLAGKPLVLHAVVKLRRICMEVSVLGSDPAFDEYAPLVRDLHTDCGPMSGIEAALAHTTRAWCLIAPVDVPFLPTAFLDWWVRWMVGEAARGARMGMFTVEGVPQPALLLIHREVAPYVAAAIERGEYKLLAALEAAGRALAEERDLLSGRVFRVLPWDANVRFTTSAPLYGPGAEEGEAWWVTTEAQERQREFWFANLNTPEGFAEAERHVDVLDT